jgi:HEAT repeat protein
VTSLDAVEARKRGDLQALLDLLADTDLMTRWAAAQQLGRLGNPAAVAPLVRALQANDDGLRVSAAKSLAMIGDHAALPALIEAATNDPASGVRVTAVDALAVLGDPRGVELLVSLALDPAPAIIATSTRYQRPAEGGRLFARFISTRDNEIAQTRRWALKRLRELRATEALPRLEAAPRPRPVRTRLALWRTLRALRSG